eukprot:TRINITY_DN96466_c0_g1_i1.p1 TRINITY_DN96466_c0_g1~~TRINITY_DN96466_c0_g1_i1.p1  ORF type:complete len:170 (+),score=30.54 TRINITY_DN96466_c0_g1_i1:34-543(+)
MPLQPLPWVPQRSATSLHDSVRLQQELEELIQDPEASCWGSNGTVQCSGDRLVWQVTLAGPEGTPYAGGLFGLAISFPKEYPHEAPKISFTTKVFHLNVGLDGEVPLGVVMTHWTPAILVRELLSAIHGLLVSPNPKEAVVSEIAAMYIHSRSEYDKLARVCTRKFAMN